MDTKLAEKIKDENLETEASRTRAILILLYSIERKLDSVARAMRK